MRGWLPGAGFWAAICTVAGLLASSLVTAGPIVSLPGPVDAEGGQSRRQLWLIPSTDPSVLMRTTVFRPPGDGPFPLIVMSHGTTENAVQRQYFPILEFEAAALWFARQGYVVAAPQRPGHGETGGVFIEDSGDCTSDAFVAAGRAAASNIQKTIDFMTTQPFVRPDDVILVGQSGGGWGTLTLVSENPPNVKAAVDFAGGRTCNGTPRDDLIAAAGILGKTSHIPTLWIYIQNDRFFSPKLSQSMVEAYHAAGGQAEYHLMPPWKEEGHIFVDYPEAVPIWAPIVSKFLGIHGPQGQAAR